MRFLGVSFAKGLKLLIPPARGLLFSSKGHKHEFPQEITPFSSETPTPLEQETTLRIINQWNEDENLKKNVYSHVISPEQVEMLKKNLLVLLENDKLSFNGKIFQKKRLMLKGSFWG